MYKDVAQQLNMDLSNKVAEKMARFIAGAMDLTQAKDLRMITGTEAENEEILDLLMQQGTIRKLSDPQFPDSYLALSDPSDVARVEERTFICTTKEEDAGPTNNWADPGEMHTKLNTFLDGCMKNRTMYVIPFAMGRPGSEHVKYAVQLTDSPYVVASMRIMTTMGTDVYEKMLDSGAKFTTCLHSFGAPLEDGAEDVPWPCNEEKFIVQFPETNEIISFGSNYGGNALLGKKCLALRIASYLGKQEGWLAEHMLIMKRTGPNKKVHYVSAAFPSACGKTNLAMLEPTIPGWKVETVGDDIAWIYRDSEGYFRAVNPEAGMFGVAPGTSKETNPQCVAALEAGGTMFTNVGYTDDGSVWWEGLTEKPPANLNDWTGKPYVPGSGQKAAQPNSRFCTPLSKLPILADEFYDGKGVKLSAMLFGGRRKTTIPLVAQAPNWERGVFYGSVLSSETTAAAAGKVGVVRRDPMAMLPFIGYSLGEYLKHWLEMGEQDNRDKLPEIFNVNWFRRDKDGSFLWPGFGDNVRVLKWVIDRLEGTVEADETLWGLTPHPEDIDISGLEGETVETVAKAVAVNPEEFTKEIKDMHTWYDDMGVIPERLKQELDSLAS